MLRELPHGDGIIVSILVGTFVGDSVTVLTPESTLTPFGAVPRRRTLKVVGATSFGEGCARPGKPGVYARVGDTTLRYDALVIVPDATEDVDLDAAELPAAGAARSSVS